MRVGVGLLHFTPSAAKNKVILQFTDHTGLECQLWILVGGLEVFWRCLATNFVGRVQRVCIADGGVWSEAQAVLKHDE